MWVRVFPLTTKERLILPAFLLIFRSNHPEEHGSTTLRFRLRLLKFATLFTRRLLPSETGIEPAVLKAMRKQHQAKAEAFLSHYQFMPGLNLATIFGTEAVPEHRLSQHRQDMLEYFTYEEAPVPFRSPTSLSLLDTLPLFIAVSAAQNVLQGHNITDSWMELAARYMAQAVLEQYLVYGAIGEKVIEEAFAYGFSADLMADADSDSLIIANLFWGGEHDGEMLKWAEIRNDHLLAVSPASNSAFNFSLCSLALTQYFS